MQNDNEENDSDEDDDSSFDYEEEFSYNFEEYDDEDDFDDDDEEGGVPELIAVLGDLPGIYPIVLNWEASVELLRERPEQGRFASYPVWDNCLTLELAAEECFKSPGAESFLQAIGEICPDQFLICNNETGELPLHKGILNSTLPVIRMMLDIHIETDFETKNGPKLTESNFNPLTALCSCYSGYIEETHREITSGEWTPTDMSDLEDDVGDNFWEKLTLLTKAYYHRSIEDVLPSGKVWRLLHACAGIDFFPPNLLKLLTAAFPDDVIEEDEDGNLPIHVAALGDFPSIHMTSTDEDYSGDFVANGGTAASTIAILLEANPASARCRNRQGKSPLQLAIESGRDWDDGIGALLAAIGDKDKETGLDLFLLAAAENRSLTIIYNLFRAEPF
jgi:ankyrin repeat protein